MVHCVDKQQYFKRLKVSCTLPKFVKLLPAVMIIASEFRQKELTVRESATWHTTRS